MRLLQRTFSLTSTPSSGADSSATTTLDSKITLSSSDHELWQNRRWLWYGYGLAVLSLIVWGYVILPRNGGFFWLWWLLTLPLAGLGGWLHWRQLQRVRSAITPTDIAKPAFWRHIPLGLVVILLVSVAANYLLVSRNPQPVRHDSFEYSNIAYDYAHNGYTAHPVRTPGYTILLAGLFKLENVPAPHEIDTFGPPSPLEPNVQGQAAWPFQVLMLLLSAILAYGLIGELNRVNRKLYIRQKFFLGEPIGLLAALLITFCPFLIAYTGITMTEIPTTFWLSLTMFLWVKTLKYPRIVLYPILTGVTLAWLLETRPTFYYLPILVAITFAVVSDGRWKRLAKPALAIIPVILFLWPQFAANLETWGEPSPITAADFSTHQTVLSIYLLTTGGLPRYQIQPTAVSPKPTYEPIWSRLQNYLPLWSGIDENGQTLSADERKTRTHAESQFFKQVYFDYITSHPLEYAGSMAQRMWLLWDQHFLFPYYDSNYWSYRAITDNLNLYYLMAGLLGFFVAIWRWGWRTAPLWLLMLYMLAVHSVVVVEVRYSLPAYPILLAFAALGTWELGRAVLGLGQWRGRVRGAVLGGAFASFAFILALSLIMPVIPPTTPDRERALDLMAQADELGQVHQFASAEQAYSQALTLAPNEGQIWSDRGDYYLGRHQLDAALSDFNKAIKLDPQAPDSYRFRGDIYFQQQLYPQAKADYQKYLELALPNDPSRAKVMRQLAQL